MKRLLPWLLPALLSAGIAPFGLGIVTMLGSEVATKRWPSCLISCNQPSPTGISGQVETI